MTRASLLIFAALAALGVLATPRAASASDISVSAAVANVRVYVGDSVVYQISVDGAAAATPPDLSKLDGLTAQYVGGQDQSSRSVTIINGRIQERASSRFVMQWRLTPLRPGRLTIPAIPVVVAGETHATEAITITALEPAESKDFKLTIEAEKAAAYVGEPIKVRLTWYLGKQVRGVQFTGSDGGQVFDIGPGPDPRPGGREDQRFPVVPFLGMQAVGRIGQGEMDGAAVSTFTLDLIVTPRQVGEVQVGPINAVFEAVVGRRERSFFDAPWDDRNVTERVVLASNTVTLDVRELPTAGRPAGFNGLIGEFGISAAAGASEANVGDPIPLTVRITGPEPMDLVAPPDLASLPGFGESFKLAPEGWQAESHGAGERRFTTTVRPRLDTVTQVPPIELPFFDTRTGRYRAAASQAIPLKVHPTRELTAADAIGSRPIQAGEGAPRPTPLAAGAAGIHANYETEDALRDQSVDVLAWAGRPAGLAILAAPPALCLAGMLAVRRGGAGSPTARRRRAMQDARRMLRRAESAPSVGLALRTYLGGALGAEASAITSADCRGLLREATPALGGAAAGLLGECERTQFAGGVAGPGRAVDELKRDAGRLLNELDRELEGMA